MRRFANQTLGGRARRIERVTVVRCTISGVMPPPERVGEWNRLRDCHATGCSHENASLTGVAIENCEINGLSRAGPNPLFLWACVFNQVRLGGRFTGIKLNPEYSLVDDDPRVQAEWAEAMRSYYRSVNWALDLREAEFTSEPTLEAIPGHLILRDPERQVLVRREALVGRNVRDLPCWPALEWFIERSPFDSVVVVGSCAKARKQKDLHALRELREIGIADPD